MLVFATKNILHILYYLKFWELCLQEKRLVSKLYYLFVCILNVQGHCLIDLQDLYDALKNYWTKVGLWLYKLYFLHLADHCSIKPYNDGWPTYLSISSYDERKIPTTVVTVL